ncbi:DoxX family protein [Arthrobacter sp. KNU-44]|uniref:DoxX family protein n=1 Tax=unclassified Arthrobacter TaxID=235627 RepID=UPI003F4414D7
MPFSWSARTTQTISAAALSALLLVSARKHFQQPKFFAPVVPDYLCRDDNPREVAELEPGQGKAAAAAPRNGALAVMSREEWIAVSGLLEAVAAVGLLIPATRRAAARGTTLMFTVFLAGHVDALRRAYSPAGTSSARRIHTLRLPLQLPLILWAWSLAGAKRGA